MLNYDSKIIYAFAERLYSRANTIVATYTAIGVIAGFVLGSFLGKGFGIIIGMAVLGAIGCALGSEKAFVLKLQAQTALCHVQIEENTRSRGVAGGEYPSPHSSASRPAV